MKDLGVQWRLFIGVGLFIALIGVIYWFVSYERAGTTMLALAAALAFFCGGWLYLQERHAVEGDRGQTDAAVVEQSAEPEHYLPTASWWPLLIGVGLVAGLNGLIINWPYAVPGVVLMAGGIVGFISESRRRA